MMTGLVAELSNNKQKQCSAVFVVYAASLWMAETT